MSIASISVASIKKVRVSLWLGLSLCLPLAVVMSIASISVAETISIASVAKTISSVSSVEEVRVSLSLGVCLGGSLGSHCQQKKSKKRHCSSVVSLDCPVFHNRQQRRPADD